MEVNWYDRTKMLIGNESVEKLKLAKVVVIGLGGVGGSCVEALCRAGIGNVMIVDNDVIDTTNINRQIIANHANIGKYKVDEMYIRQKSINPDLNIIARKDFCLPENIEFIFEYTPDYVVDAIDTITTKIFLAQKTKEEHINFISCMGMGNRLDPSLIRYGSISDTSGSGCAVAKIIRSKLRKNNISDINVVYSMEKPKKVVTDNFSNGIKHFQGSFSCVPPVAGYFLAYKVVHDLLSI